MFRLKNKNISTKDAVAKKFVLTFFVSVCIAIFGLFPSLSVQAATSYFSPSSGSFEVGSVFTVAISINTKGVDVNNAEGTVRFPSDLLEVVSLNKSGSIFSLWVEEPNFSNSAGTLSFNGGLPTPGFNGSSGRIFSAVFRAKKAGSASLLFPAFSILANDGLGTNVFSGSGSANYELVVTEVKSETTVPPKATDNVPEVPVKTEEPSGLPITPRVSSPTHPDQGQWYSSNSPKFTWSVPSGVTGVRYAYDASSSSRPSSAGQSLMSEKQLQGISDGVWYSHVQFINEKGLGGVTHFRFQIDSTKPSKFEITEISRKDSTSPIAEFIFDAKDDLSGIDHYEVQIDNGASETWKDDGSHHYQTPALNPGEYALNVSAFDKAGHSIVSSVAFKIEGLKIPTITEYPKELSGSDSLIVRGLTIANSKVIITLQREHDDLMHFNILSDQDGKFVFVPEEKLKEGVYTLWAEVVDSQGLKSEPSGNIIINVTKKLAVSCTGVWTMGSLVVTISLLALIVLLGCILWYAWYRFFALRKKIKKQVSEAELALYEAFTLLKKEIREQVEMLEKTKTKRDLTREEERIIKQLRKQLVSAEKSVKKEIEDIEKEVK